MSVLIDKNDLLKRIQTAEMFNTDCPQWVKDIINGMPCYADAEEDDRK